MPKDSSPNESMLWIVWGSLLASIGAYAVVVHVLSMPASFEGHTLELLTYGLVAVSVVTAVTAHFIRKIMYSPEQSEDEYGDRDKALSAYFNACIVAWSLCESVAIYGVVLRVLSGEVLYYYPFAAAAVVLFVLYRPRPDEHLPTQRDSGGS